MVLHCQQIAQLYLTSISLLQSIHINGICRSRAFACLTTRSISFMALKSIFSPPIHFFDDRMNDSKPLDKFSRSPQRDRKIYDRGFAYSHSIRKNVLDWFVYLVGFRYTLQLAEIL